MSENQDKKNWIIIIIFNCIVYGLCCLIIIKKKNFTYISIRSPTLLLIANFSNFLISISLLLYKITGENLISFFYYIFRLTMIASILLRYERIMACFKINIQKFYNKRRLLQEKFYVRILLLIFAIFFILLMIINFVGNKTFELFNISSKDELFKTQMMTWVIWNFIEQLILVTYIFRIYKQNLKYILSLELYILFIILFLYNNYCDIIYLIQKNNNIDFVVISLIVLYICLFLNGLLPIIMTLCSKVIISYNFTPKLINNLYLFLTNEECYRSFNFYLIKKGNNGSFYLKLYTHIMKFKLDLALNINRVEGLNEANEIFNNYFNSENYSQQIDHETLQKVRDKCQILKLNSYNKEIFDDGLQYAFNELNKRFLEYRNSNEFQELLEEINMHSFIQCKMCNTGLINKF